MWIRTLLGSIVLGAGIVTTAGAQVESHMDDIKDQNANLYEVPWQERREVDFPPPPAPDNLIALDNEAIGSGYEYFVDSASVSLGGDQVLRYIVVVDSETGTRATYYEGMRCETRQVKTYGFVNRRGAFESMASSRWTRLPTSGPYAYRHFLAEQYMCDRDGWPISKQQVLNRLVRNSPSGVRVRPKSADLGK